MALGTGYQLPRTNPKKPLPSSGYGSQEQRDQYSQALQQPQSKVPSFEEQLMQQQMQGALETDPLKQVQMRDDIKRSMQNVSAQDEAWQAYLKDYYTKQYAGAQPQGNQPAGGGYGV